jgi:hypothetical protein
MNIARMMDSCLCLFRVALIFRILDFLGGSLSRSADVLVTDGPHLIDIIGLSQFVTPQANSIKVRVGDVFVDFPFLDQFGLVVLHHGISSFVIAKTPCLDGSGVGIGQEKSKTATMRQRDELFGFQPRRLVHSHTVTQISYRIGEAKFGEELIDPEPVCIVKPLVRPAASATVTVETPLLQVEFSIVGAEDQM